MAKTTRRHIEKGRCEQREYKIINRIIADGRVRFIVTCPFCGYKQSINLETGIVECRHGRKKPGE